MSKKKSPFDYVKSINTKSEYEYDLSGYVPYLTNRAFAMHMDTIMYAEEMNQYNQLDPALQYDFYYNGVRKGRRFGFPKKEEEHPPVGTGTRILPVFQAQGTGSPGNPVRVRPV